ncbi:MAG TPA: arginine--tRNA ligase, partial [Candidatus Paceibacterota bacterium]
MAKEEIKRIIKNALTHFSIQNTEVNLEPTEDLEHGDYSTNVALRYAKELGQSPLKLAEKIVSEFLKNKPEGVEKVDIAGPGFINFYLSPEVLRKNIETIIKNGEAYGKNTNLKGQKVMVEYTDPNPFKEFHIGHLMSNAIGESISRIIEVNGAEVKRANYQGDVGMHVAKAIWGVVKSEEKDYESIRLWGEAYVSGARAYEENEESKKEILEINKKIYDHSDEEINAIYDKGRKASLDHFEDLYRKLGTKFDFYFFESETGDFGKKIVEENIGKIFEKSDGAIIFPGEKHGLHTRVFINSEGLPTYEAKELGLAKIKYEK